MLWKIQIKLRWDFVMKKSDILLLVISKHYEPDKRFVILFCK